MDKNKIKKAKSLQEKGQLNRASLIFTELLASDPKLFSALYGLGIISAEQGDFVKALNLFKKATPGPKEKAKYYLYLGHIYRKLKEFANALEAYQNAAKAGLKSVDLHLSLANLYMLSANQNAALLEYDAALKLDPASTLAHYQLGLYFLKTRSYDWAKIQFNNVLNLNPHDINALFHLAVCSLYKEELDEAQSQLEQVLKFDPEYIEAFINLGALALKKGQGQEAINNFTKALTLNPENTAARSNLAATFMHYSRHENALTHYLILLQRDPSNLDYLYNSAVAEMTLGQYENAKAKFLSILAIDEKHFETLYNLGVLTMRLRQTSKAITYLANAHAIKPTDASCCHLLNALRGSDSSNEVAIEHALQLFDQYSSYYEKHLLQTLNYRLPVIIGSFLTTHDLNNRSQTLDLGCGTGLCGEIIKPMTKYLVGVDLSAKMIERAQEKTCYDECIIDEALHFLQNCSQEFDLIIASDLFPYIGELDAYFTAINKCLKNGGSFIFTIETTTNKPWMLQETARFAHNIEYIETLCINNSLKVCSHETKPARDQAGEVLPVELFWVFKN
ncbi:MAG: hypothetical protein A3F18_03195 [Legionellales bacterium RIFCSPHIGHO2_12_FULL_37_14]|nr:MAG: hypothetical protein A3F18_03195 [Legionellales bacterium RIFCSPHIGHO2_12_FULL_37_14]